MWPPIKVLKKIKFKRTGNDDQNFVNKELYNLKIDSLIIEDENRPTTFKTRYLVDAKSFRVSRLNEIRFKKYRRFNYFNSWKRNFSVQGVLISDFVMVYF